MNKVIFVLGFFAAAQAFAESVDVAVVLATDVSGSISDTENYSEYKLQKRGIATALRDPELAYILKNCNGAGLALTYTEWSGQTGRTQYKQVIGWRKLRDGNDLRAFADEVDGVRARSSGDDTDVRQALRSSADLLRTMPYEASLKIISISSDGEQSVAKGRSERDSFDPAVLAAELREERDRILAEGIVIDGLVITNDPNSGFSGLPLEEYYRRYVVGGANHILVPIETFEDYAEGFGKKLRRELDHCGF